VEPGGYWPEIARFCSGFHSPPVSSFQVAALTPPAKALGS
jgi:hypothetical protein